ncbi:Protein TAR1 [Capsicum baccatum]|uniref:Protein TAR1 n=1 Tax=Capsicum baccatum TaxID=33114 RepID=A0A2G2UX11_CAPBA|nr:Protein TAR1 [Capsicum baccatum]
MVHAPSRSADRHIAVLHPSPGASPDPIRFPLYNLEHSLTLFSKSFSSFPCGTCSLSVSRPYLALDGIHRQIWAAFPNNSTHRQRLVVRQGPGTTGLSPSPTPPSRGLGPGPPLTTAIQTTIRMMEPPDSKVGLFPVHSLLLRESLQVSFPPLIDMLKLSGQMCPRPNGFGRNLRSKTRWFTGFCNSHQVLYFAAFFINARAEISVAESLFHLQKKHRSPRRTPRTGREGQAIDSSIPWRFPRWGSLVAHRASWACALGTGGGTRLRCQSTPPARTPQLFNTFAGSFCCAGFDNDPSAGSPTETLLRLVLPLNDKVQWTSSDVAGSEPPTSPRSKHFTGSFNR